MHDAEVRALLAVYGGMGGTWAPLMIAASIVGGGWGSLALAPMLWWTRTRRFAGAIATAIAAQAVVVWSMKLLVGRVRPWIALGLPPPIQAPHDGSFPSGHAAGCFCVVAFLAVALPAAWPTRVSTARWAVLGATVLACLVALSRVYLGAHYIGDVVAGAVVGGTIGFAAGRVYRRQP
jgi:undecaprenyl-diphosphatase